jgi:hypothetical protein
MSSLEILGTEVIQTIQCFDHKSKPESNNSVPLVANKKTLVRVYVGSLDKKEIGNVTGSLKVGTKTFDPINKAITARPAENIDRNKWDHTLNFLINPSKDLALSDDVQIVPSVWINKEEITEGAAQTLTFYRIRGLTLMVILIDDPNLEPPKPPKPDDYEKSLEGARRRYPISEDGFILKWPLGDKPINLKNHNIDLFYENNWQHLLNVIYDIDHDYHDSEDSKRIWTAIVPNDDSYPVDGLGTVGKSDSGTTAFIVKATLPATFAHEMGHNFKLKDTADGNSGWPGETEDIGWNPDELENDPLILKGTIELMSYSDEKRWPSIQFWNNVFYQLLQK